MQLETFLTTPWKSVGIRFLCVFSLCLVHYSGDLVPFASQDSKTLGQSLCAI